MGLVLVVDGDGGQGDRRAGLPFSLVGFGHCGS